MHDDEVAAYVAAAVGCPREGACVERLGGLQGLVTCRVSFPGVGSFVYKAVRPRGRREIALTVRLAAAAPDLVAPVVAHESDEARGVHWLVCADVGTDRLAEHATQANYVGAARAIAQLQVATLHDVTGFRDAGVPCVGHDHWEDVALRVIENVQAASAPMVWGHTADVERAAWSTSDIVRDTQSVPEALIHGDLHAGNVVVTDAAVGSVRLLDWGSAYIGPALLGLEELMWPAERHLRDHNALAAVRSAYVREWAAMLGRPAYWTRARAACQALVRLTLLDDALSGQRDGPGAGEYAAAVAARGFVNAWREWTQQRV